MEKIILKADNLNFKYRNEYILYDINLEIKQSDFILILGRRGEGKSTLLKILAGLISIEEGNIFYEKINLRTAIKSELVAIQQKTAFVFQDSALISNMKVFDNIALPLRYNKIYPEEEIEKIVQKRLAYVNLQDIKSLLPAFISAGQRKLIALLRAVVINPETIFYDEPLTNLDRQSQHMAKKIIRDTLRKNVTSIVVSNELKELGSFVTKVIILKDRTIYKVGTLKEIKDSKDEYISGLIE